MRSIALVSSLVLLGSTVAYGQSAAVKEESSTVTQATIEVEAPPAVVYALMTDYANWRTYLTDIASVMVKSGGRRDAVVQMSSRALEHTVTVRFDNDTGRLVLFKLADGPPGARSWGAYTLTATDKGAHTRIDARLYMDVVGAPGLFIRDKTIRKMRQKKLRADLEDLARWVRTHPKAPSS